MQTNITVSRALDRSALRGVALIVLGIMAIAFPAAASIATTFVVGWVLVVAGCAHLIFAWRTESNTVFWTAFISLAYVLAGMAILANPFWGIATITLVLGVALAIEGILSVVMYFTSEQTSRWVLFNGVVTVVLALIIASGWLSRSLWMIGTIVGVNLLVAGVAELAAWIEHERVSHQRAW